MKSVYLLQSDSGLYKIGVSKNPSKRVRQLQTGNGEKIRLIYSFETDIPFLVEQSLQNHFMMYKVNGEWFNLSLEDELEFLNLCQKSNENIKRLLESGNLFL